MRITLAPQVSSALPPAAFDALMVLPGVVQRRVKQRETLRVTIAGRDYFLKRHFGVSLREVAKNLSQLRWPVLGAGTEARGIRRLQALGVPTVSVVGEGERGLNPLQRQSFILTEALPDTITLEELSLRWSRQPFRSRSDMLLKRALLVQIAGIARSLHENGVNHRDFYLCHFRLEQDSPGLHSPGGALFLHVMDLHRAQLRRRTPWRWRVKDIASLYFSALDAGLTRRDCLRFMRLYGATPLRDRRGRRFWRSVSDKAVFLYRKAHGRSPKLPLEAG